MHRVLSFHRALVFAVAALALSAPHRAHAAPPALLPVQGYLTDEAGVLLADGDYTVRFRLYDSADPGNVDALHDETLDVAVVDGYFTVYLGDTDNGGEALDLSVFRDLSEVFLGVKVGVDPEAVPRLQVASTAFAASASYCGDAETLDGVAAADYARDSHTHAFSDLTGIPSGLSNGDDNTTYTAGAGLSLASGAFSLNSSGCSSGYALRWTGSAWACQDVSVASDLSGGSAGAIPYQASGGNTSMLPLGSQGALLKAGGSAPQWFSGTTGGLLYYDGDEWASSTVEDVHLSGGWLGVGTDSPVWQIHVATPDSAVIRLDGAGTNQPAFTSLVEAMRPDPKRAAGMMITGPDYKWFVGAPYYQTGTGLDFMIGYNTADQAERSGNYRFILDTGGNGELRGALTEMSDARLKQKIEPIKNALELLMKLRGVSFEWKNPEEHANQTGRRMGMIAQQVEQVLPTWVLTRNGVKSVGYIGFEGLTVEAVREIKTEQDRLAAENARLTAENKSLSERLDRLERLVSLQSVAPAKHASR